MNEDQFRKRVIELLEQIAANTRHTQASLESGGTGNGPPPGDGGG